MQDVSESNPAAWGGGKEAVVARPRASAALEGVETIFAMHVLH
jgi:hypothetical protein